MLVATVSKCLEYVRIPLGFKRSSEILAVITMRFCSPSDYRSFSFRWVPIDNFKGQSLHQSTGYCSKLVSERLQPSVDLKSFEVLVGYS